MIDEQQLSVLHPCSTTIGQLRPPRHDIVGRDGSLAQVCSYLRETQAQGAMVCISGADGVGKTAFAYAIAHQIKADVPDAQIVVPLQDGRGQPYSPQRLLQHVIHTFRPQSQVSDDLAVLQERYRTVLNGKRVLILLDDVVTQELARVLPALPGCILLLTSTIHLDIPTALHVHLESLPLSAATQLVQTICPHLESEAQQLAQACGGIPLALRISAGMIAQEDALMVANLLEHAKEGVLTITHLLNLCYERLSPLEQATLYQLSVFRTEFDLEAAKAVINLQSIKPSHKQESPEKSRGRAVIPSTEQILHHLVQINLLDYDSEAESYTLHTCVQRFAASQGQDQSHICRYAKHYALVATDIEGLYLQGGDAMFEGLAVFDQEREHIEKGWAWAKASQDDNLLLNYSCVIGHTGLLRYHVRHEYIPQLELALAAAKRLKRKGDVCHVLNVLGSAYRSLGELNQAIGYYQQALGLLQTVRKQSNEVSVLGNLGNACLGLGDVPQAIKHYQRSLKIAQRNHDMRGECAALGQLGLAYAEKGQTQRAIEHYEQSLGLARQYGYQDYEHEVLTGLAQVSIDSGNTEEAIVLCERALAVIQQTGNRRDEGYTLLLLGLAHRASGQEGRAYLEQARAIASEVGDQRLEGRTLNGLGEDYLAQGDGTTAKAHLEQARLIAQTIGDRRGEALSSWNLALALNQEEPAGEAERERITALMQVRVAYEQAMDHPAWKAHADALITGI